VITDGSRGPDREAATTDASGNLASDHTAAAADVDALTSGEVEQAEIGLARSDYVFRLGATFEPSVPAVVSTGSTVAMT